MVGALLPVVNPLGDAPIFLAMTPGCDELTRADLAKRNAIYSYFLFIAHENLPFISHQVLNS